MACSEEKEKAVPEQVTGKLLKTRTVLISGEIDQEVAEQTISKNLNVQPTIQIRPGYKFNVLVDQDIVFPGNYGG